MLLRLLALDSIDKAAREGGLVVQGVVGAQEVVPQGPEAVVEQLRGNERR